MDTHFVYYFWKIVDQISSVNKIHSINRKFNRITKAYVSPEHVIGEFERFRPNNRTVLPPQGADTHFLPKYCSYPRFVIQALFSHRYSSIYTLLINFNSTYYYYYYLRCEVRVLVSASYSHRR